MQTTTTQEDTMQATTEAPAYGTPEAKALIKQLKQQEDALRAQMKADRELQLANMQQGLPRDQGCLGEDARRVMYREAWDLKCQRIDLQTAPLPRQPRDLPAYVVPEDQLGAQGPQDTAAYQVGDEVTIYSRGRNRRAVVVEARRTNLEVAYTTQGALADMGKYHNSQPNHTRKVVRLQDVYGHSPQGRDVVAQAAERTQVTVEDIDVVVDELHAALEVLGADTATTSREQDMAQLQATMATHRAGYLAYAAAREQLKVHGEDGDNVARAVRDENHPAYTAYKRAYRQLLQLRKEVAAG
jgi:hypothetical protein